MALTQIGSLNIGDLTDDITIEKASGVYSRYGNIVHITDGKTDQILAIATAKNVLDNEHHASLKDNIDTFEMELIGEQNYDEHLLKGNRLIIPAENEGEMLEFVINEVEDIRGHSKIFDVKAYASYLDLQKAKAIKPFTRTGTAREHMFYALADTEFEVGLTESAREITISFENYTNPYEYLRRIAREFELELNFRVVHNGLFVTNRVVDAVGSIGDFRGREVTFGKDLQEIRRLEAGDIYTALIGLGPEREDGSRLEVFVEDLDALRRWGRPEHNPKHLIGVYEPQSEREDMTLSQLRQYTKTELDKRKNSVINYEISFLDLENLIGDDAKKIRKGDTIRIKDTYFTPHLYVEARVLDVKRNAVVPAQKEFILGDFVEYDAETIHDLYAYVKRELTKKAGIQMLLEYAEPKKVESDTAPTIKDGENPIWVDTSKTPKVAHVVIGGQWQKMTPTTPQEVNAYTKQQVDNVARQESEAKAAQALADAKAFSRNANNITEGVIDVGAIPLRTSVTGARLEWDGVNGLVQYNALGEPVSWLDLDANAHFANAFLSGRVEANEGYFGENIRLRDGKMEIVRPDGAISMSDGMVASDYSISGYDPHLMDFGQIDDAQGTRFPAWDSLNAGNWYTAVNGSLDGRGIDVGGGTVPYKDIRDPDKSYTIRFQRYEFIHTARYLKFDYQIAVNNSVRQHRVLFDEITPVPQGSKPIQTLITFADGDRGLKSIVIDLGKPSYERRSFDFRIGWLRNGGVWGDANSITRFRVPRISQSDILE